jgi:nicotinamidase/pyrazinamidase
LAESSQSETGTSGEDTGVLVVDVQGDFTAWKNGSLAVRGTDGSFVKSVEDSTRRLYGEGYPVFGTQDWHPADHVSFYTSHPGAKPFDVKEIEGRRQVLWPPHCVQGTENARVLVDNSLFQIIVRKGHDRRYDSYSGFQDEGGRKTELDRALKEKCITKLIVYGIAIDYCVKATALDAIEAGYRVIVIEALSRGVDPDTERNALAEMRARGVVLMPDLDPAAIRSL